MTDPGTTLRSPSAPTPIGDSWPSRWTPFGPLRNFPRERRSTTGLCEHYLFNYPGLGYADAPLSNGHNFWVESLAELIRGEPMPPCIYALYNYPWLGGENVRGLIRYTFVDEELSSEIVLEFRDGRYTIILVRIRKDSAVCPA